MNETQTPNRPHFVAVEIPANTETTGVTLASLIGNIGRPINAIIVDKNQPASAVDRDAFLITAPRPGSQIAATDFANHSKMVRAGEEEYLAADRMHDCYVRSSTASPVVALLIVL